jgi:ubiquinone/menaquinone biosynthesis C-methylase UbiE
MVCPWWLGGLLASRVRRLVQDPARLLAPWVRPGAVVLEPGPGMGFFTLELARRVGPEGRVIAVDVQPRMLAGLARRARREGLERRIDLRLARGAAMPLEDLAGRVAFALAFAVVHELPDAARFFADVRRTLAPGAPVLLVEPSGHVSEAAFAAELEAARGAGLASAPGPRVWRSRSAVLAPA